MVNVPTKNPSIAALFQQAQVKVAQASGAPLFRRLRGALPDLATPRTELCDPPRHDIEHGGEHQAESGHADHTGKDRGSKRLPQFGASFAVLTLLGLVFCAMTFLWLACYAMTVAKMGDLLRRSPAGRVLDAVTGTALIALGVRLATEQP